MIEGTVWKGTCPIDSPRDYHITFARTREHLQKLRGVKIHLGVYVPKEIDRDGIDPEFIALYECDFFEYRFVQFHNKFYENKSPAGDIFNGDVHPTVVIDEGIHITIGPDNKRIQLKHMGNVIVEAGARVGPLTFIQRASLPGCSTIIRKGVLIDGYCMIGHNAVIGENSLIVAGSIVGAGSKIGKNCLIGVQTAIRPHTTICDNVVTGIGSVVVKDIDKPGIYMGNPAKFYKEHPKNWMW